MVSSLCGFRGHVGNPEESRWLSAKKCGFRVYVALGNPTKGYHSGPYSRNLNESQKVKGLRELKVQGSGLKVKVDSAGLRVDSCRGFRI